MKNLFVLIGCIIFAVWLFSPQENLDGISTSTSTNPASPNNTAKLWVVADRLNRRTCPDETCGVVGRLFFREGVTPLGFSGNWVRTTLYYDASCVNGKSEYVDSGSNECAVENGISEGRFAEWVSIKFLSETRPADPANNTIGREALIAQSDDFRLYRRQFAQAAEKLIGNGQCTEADFQDIGGFVKSTNHAAKPIYFIYCGGFTVAHRIYVNVETGKISR